MAFNYQSFGQVIQPNGPNVGFPGNVSRQGERVIKARQVSDTNNLSFGAAAVLLSNATGGLWESVATFLATAANAQNLQQYFAGIAVREVTTQLQFTSLVQGSTSGIPVSTTTSGSTAAAATTIVVTSATGILIGQAVEALYVPANTFVTAISGTSITISLPTTGIIPTATTITFTTQYSSNTGYYPNGQLGEVLERGSITVVIAAGSPQANYPVYIRVLANAALPGTAIGDLEAADDVMASPPTTSTTVGSATLTVSSGTGVAIGMRVTGPGIPANTYLTAGATTSWTMSNLATATTSTATSAFSNMALLGTLVDPWLVFTTGQLDGNLVAEINIKTRHAA